MRQKFLEAREGNSAMFAAELLDLFPVRAADGGNFDTRNGTRGARVGSRDVSAAHESDANSHG
jgi:hypothetical protein